MLNAECAILKLYDKVICGLGDDVLNRNCLPFRCT